MTAAAAPHLRSSVRAARAHEHQIADAHAMESDTLRAERMIAFAHLSGTEQRLPDHRLPAALNAAASPANTRPIIVRIDQLWC